MDLWLGRIPKGTASRTGPGPLLTRKENERAEGIIVEEARVRYLWSRAALRCLLGSWLNLRPESLEIRQGEHGKPYLAGPTEQSSLPKFNLSHDGDVVLIGISSRGEIGVDIALPREGSDPRVLAERFFLPEEAAELREHDDPARGFLRIWSAKEAFGKALGIPIGIALVTSAFSEVPAATEVRGDNLASIKGQGLGPETPELEPLSPTKVFEPRYGSPGEWSGVRFRCGDAGWAAAMVWAQRVRFRVREVDVGKIVSEAVGRT